MFAQGDAGIYAVDSDGSRLQTIVDPSINTVRANGGHLVGLMTYFDISPDGSQIVYSTCKYPNSDRRPPNELASWEFSYEIVAANIDGTNTRRITNNDHFDNFPVWSPDGSQIAFVSDIDPSHNAPETHGRLMVYTMATGELRDLTPAYSRDPVAPHPPVWSPDGRHIALLAYDSDVVFDSEEGNWDWVLEPLSVYVVRAGAASRGPGRNISRAFSEPSWSPDGSRIAMVAPWANRAALFTFAPDGSDPVFIASIADRVDDLEWLNRVYWSPDGSRIMFTGTGYVRYSYYDPYDFESWDPSFVESWGPPYTAEDKGCKLICVASADGAFVTDASAFRFPSGQDDVRKIYLYPLLPDRLSWSPDGSRIAVLSRGEPRSGDAILYTMDPDGNDARVLVRMGENRDLIASNSDPVNLDSCSNGVVVPDPEENPGLVEDCRTLLSVMDTLGGSASLELSLGWGTDRPIAEWSGVSVGGDPPRVRSLVLPGVSGFGGLAVHILQIHALFGRIPPELGDLSELRELNLGSNDLTGPIPLELGKLANLEVLVLSGNYLRGSIPAELGSLTNLRYLSLAYNQLTGDIPVELGKLLNLEVLGLSRNDLDGSIPVELGKLTNLEILNLNFNDLSGGIPVELGELTNLEVLDLSGNYLRGSIPAELGSLTNLRELDLAYNQLTGDIPVELGNLPNLEKVYLGPQGSPFYNQFSGCVPMALVDKIAGFDELGLPPCEQASDGR